MILRLGILAAFSAFFPSGCVSDSPPRPIAEAACPEGLSLRAETIGLSYVVVGVDSCAARPGRFELDHVLNGDSARDIFTIDAHTGWFLASSYPIFPGSYSRYRVTAHFPDSTHLRSDTLAIAYPDSSGDFAPIDVGQSLVYAYGYRGTFGSYALMIPDTVETDTGTFAFRVVGRRDSSGVAIFQVEYRDSIVHGTRSYLDTNSHWAMETRLSRDTVRCVDSEDSLDCEPVRNRAAQMRFPWAKTHVQRAPNLGLVMPVGGEATSCSHEANQILPYGVGLVQAWESSFTPHSRGFGTRTGIRLVSRNGAPVDYRVQADLCSKDFPAIPDP
jgi:hypothetical protein